MINEMNSNRLDISDFAIGDDVIIKLKLSPCFEYYGMIQDMSTQNVKIRGKFYHGLPLLILCYYKFKPSSIEYIKPYTYEGAEAGRQRATNIINEKMNKFVFK